MDDDSLDRFAARHLIRRDDQGRPAPAPFTLADCPVCHQGCAIGYYPAAMHDEQGRMVWPTEPVQVHVFHTDACPLRDADDE